MDIILNTRFGNDRLPKVSRTGFVDEFTHPVGTVLTETEDGKPYIYFGDPWVIAADGHAVGTGKSYTLTADGLSADGILTAVLGTPGPTDQRGGIAFRARDQNNLLGVWVNSNGWITYYERVSGSSPVNQVIGGSLEAGDSLSAEFVGPEIRIYHNGISIHSTTTSRFLTEPAHGLIGFVGMSDSTWDSVEFIAK